MVISEIKIEKFKKLENVNIEFSNINLITGKNATGKSSLLHIISNSFQTPKMADYKNSEIKKIKKLSNNYNLKFEKLTKGDMVNNDPAIGVTPYYTCIYSDGKSIKFRKHNSGNDDAHRFSVKPQYGSNKKETLPKVMCLYLGLKRITPIGEIFEEVKNTNFSYSKAEEWISNQYKSITGVTLEKVKIMELENHENKVSFHTDITGIDSNTISAGQDSLLSIICSLYVLKFHNENIESGTNKSVLLIDEFDITLHPEFQMKLMRLLDRVCREHDIQAFMTTHSFEAIKFSSKLEWNIIYLRNAVNATNVMKNPTILKIKADLENKIRREVIKDIHIPCFFEDDEAHLFFQKIFALHKDNDINEMMSYIKRVEGSYSSGTIKNIFVKNQNLLNNIRSIGVLDGDQTSGFELKNHVVALPGGASPEGIIFELLDDIAKNPTKHVNFLNSEYLLDLGYTHDYLLKINVESNKIDEDISDLKEQGKSSKGVKRTKNKSIWNENLELVEILIEHWIRENSNSVDQFISNFKIVYNMTVDYYDLDRV